METGRGKPAKARAWLDKATQWLEQIPRGIAMVSGNPKGPDLHNWLEAEVLRREAQALLSR